MTVLLIFCQLRRFVNFVDILLTWLRHFVSFTDTFHTDSVWTLLRHSVDILSTLLRHSVNFTETFWWHFVNFTAVKASASQTWSLCTSSGWPNSSRQSRIYLHKTKGNQLTDTALPLSWTSDWPKMRNPADLALQQRQTSKGVHSCIQPMTSSAVVGTSQLLTAFTGDFRTNLSMRISPGMFLWQPFCRKKSLLLNYTNSHGERMKMKNSKKSHSNIE